MALLAGIDERFSVGQACVSFFQLSGILSVVVAVVDVGLGNAMAVSAGVEHGSGGVHRLRREKHRAGHVVELLDAVADVLASLVQSAPADDARVAVVAMERFQPLGDEVRAGPFVAIHLLAAFEQSVAAPVAELAPDEVTEPVSVIKEALLENFLVQARAVESGGE